MNVSGKMNPFETTRSGKGYVKKIKEWKNQGYGIIIYFLKLPSAEFAIERVKLRVAKGRHNVPVQDVKRRYERSWHNFSEPYKPLADSWVILDTSGDWPIIVDESGQPNEKT